MDRSTIGKKSKQKGNIGEREHAHWLTLVTGVEWRRTPASGSYHLDFPFDAFKAGKEETPLDNVGNENKFTKSLAVGDWIDQTEVACCDYFNVREYPKWYVRFARNGKRYFIIPQSFMEQLIKHYDQGTPNNQ